MAATPPALSASLEDLALAFPLDDALLDLSGPYLPPFPLPSLPASPAPAADDPSLVVHHHHHHHHHAPPPADAPAPAPAAARARTEHALVRAKARAAEAAAQAEADAATRAVLGGAGGRVMVVAPAPPAAVPGGGGGLGGRGGPAGAAGARAERAIARKRGNNTHTRRCRKKVNDKFEELLSILPPPDDPKETPVKHKAQILAYSIARIREVTARNHYLELMLAMSSRDALAKWIDRVVAPAATLAQALEPFMELLCTTRQWKYAELWEPGGGGGGGGGGGRMRICAETARTDDSVCAMRDAFVAVAAVAAAAAAARGGAGAGASSSSSASTSSASDGDAEIDVSEPQLRYVGSTMPPDLPAPLTARLRGYRDHSREFTFQPRSGVPGRVFLTRRPEWLPWLTDPVAFPRSPHAQQYGVKLTFAVPVVIRDQVRMVVEFYDSDAREYDPDILNVATDIAALIGKAFAARHEPDGAAPGDPSAAPGPPPPAVAARPAGPPSPTSSLS